MSAGNVLDVRYTESLISENNAPLPQFIAAKKPTKPGGAGRGGWDGAGGVIVRRLVDINAAPIIADVSDHKFVHIRNEGEQKPKPQAKN